MTYIHPYVLFVLCVLLAMALKARRS